MRLLLAPILLLAACGASQTPDGPTPATAITVTTAVASAVEQQVSEQLPGTVRAARSAVLQARIPGVVAAMHATPGAQVAAGTLLVELDAQEIAAKRDQARAAAAQAAADFARIDGLFATQAVTKAEFDAARARADGSRAAAAEAEIMVGYTRLAAPFAGLVVRRHAEVGDLLAPGRPVVELEDPAALRLEVEVPESLAPGVAMGARLRVQVGAAALDGDGEVVEIIPAADPVSRSVLVKLALPAAPGLRSGQFGRAAVPVALGRRLAVPAAAVVRHGQLESVYVVSDGAARLRLVRTGGEVGGRIAIRAGLAEGEVVVVEPGRLRDGQPVTVR